MHQGACAVREFDLKTSLLAFRDLPVGVAILQLPNPKDLRSLRLIGANQAVERELRAPIRCAIGKPIAETFPKFLDTPAAERYRQVALSGMPEILGEFTYQEFNDVVAVNLRAPFFASQAVIPVMKANGGGRIIHMSSQHGIVAGHERALYGATKAALAFLARGMAYELSTHNILVNAVSPGPIASEAYEQRMAADPERARHHLAYLPLGRPGEPAEVASVVAFLASDEATFIQGQNIVVDGGFIIH